MMFGFFKGGGGKGRREWIFEGGEREILRGGGKVVRSLGSWVMDGWMDGFR